MASFQERLRAARRAALPQAEKPAKVKKPKVKPVEKNIDPRGSVEKQAKGIIKARRENMATPKRDRPYPTLPLNLHEKIAIQVDKNTTVYASPGADVDAIKAKYGPERHANKPKERF